MSSTDIRKPSKARRIVLRSLIALALVIVIIIVIAVIISNNSSSDRSAEFGRGSTSYQEDTYEPEPPAVHLAADNTIDKTYSYNQLKKLSKKERAADDVVLFDQHSYYGSGRGSIQIPTSVAVDGVSYPYNAFLNITVESQDTAITDYNKLVTGDPGISLRGNKNIVSLEQYVADVVTLKITSAMKTGTLAAPTVAYNGTGTEYHNDDLATAYKAGVNASLFAQQCDPNGPMSNSCVPTTATYDFSCKTVGVTYPDWNAFVDQVASTVPAPYISYGSAPQGDLKLDTAVPCRITQNPTVSVGPPAPPTTGRSDQSADDPES